MCYQECFMSLESLESGAIYIQNLTLDLAKYKYTRWFEIRTCGINFLSYRPNFPQHKTLLPSLQVL